MMASVKKVCRLVLAMIGMSGCDKGPPVVALEQLVGTSPLKSPPLLVTGSTERRFLATFEKQLYVFDLEGRPVGDPQPVPFVVREIYPTSAGAVAVSREGLLSIEQDGTVQSPVMFSQTQDGIYWAFAQGKEEILVASVDPHKELTIEFYGYDGSRRGERVRVQRPQFGAVLAASLLGQDQYVLVWEEGRSLYAAIVSPQGHMVKPPFEMYAVGRGGALQRGYAQPQSNGSVLISWQDSSPGPWSVMALIMKPDGTVERNFRLNINEKTDATRVSIPQGGKGQWVAWISGEHWGQFSVSGQGSVALQSLENANPNLIFQAKGGISTFSMVMKEDKAFTLGAVRQASPDDQTLGYNVFSGLASFTSLTIQN